MADPAAFNPIPAGAPRNGGLQKAGVLLYRYRVYLLAAVIYGLMSCIAPYFTTAGNFGNMLKAMSCDLPAAIGFTLVLICGQLDLSVGSTMTLGGMVVLRLQPQLGWVGAFGVAAAAGLAVGLTNGLLVAKAKINSFIVTLGTMIIVQNVVFLFCKGDTLSASTYDLKEWLDGPLIWVLSPRVLLALAIMAVMAVFLNGTPLGKGFFLLGGNVQTAWYSGLSVTRYTVGAFVLSGGLSAIGGALFAMSEGTANARMGESSLMAIVAAVIIGGTSMEGGRGSIPGTTVALFALAALINGLNCRGAGFEVQLMASGVVLAAVILYDAIVLRVRERKRGQRLDLLKELEAMKSDRG